ncbi:acylglycerol kinase, mitochondrial-like [Lineus longissimus]|uniref:acylglycerol kinase, mitochondrial-like n=1 Tax=Lineus longissimus TaxID=88925 RepID=UPI002B4D4C1C
MAARVVGFAKTIRNNWKKSLFASGLIAWGGNFAKQKYQEEELRRKYCAEAKKYGDQPVLPHEKPRKVTVFLNPAARSGKARKLFEKNVAPLLHLAGFEVGIVKTEYEGQAKKYMDVLENADCVMVAGGDGTLLEVVTGLLRRSDKLSQQIPVGVLPLGNVSSFAGLLFGYREEKELVQWLIDATMAVIKGSTKPVNVLSVKGKDDKTVYSVSGIEWGAYREAEKKKKKNWYFGKFKHHYNYLKYSIKQQWPPEVKGELVYGNPCSGCSACRPAPEWRWWHVLFKPRFEDFTKIINEDCGVQYHKEVNGVQFTARSNNYFQNENEASTEISISPVLERKDFLKEGFSKLDKKPYRDITSNSDVLTVGSFKFTPHLKEDEEAWFYIDNEEYDAMPIEVTVLKNGIHVFYDPQGTGPS